MKKIKTQIISRHILMMQWLRKYNQHFNAKCKNHLLGDCTKSTIKQVMLALAFSLLSYDRSSSGCGVNVGGGGADG